MTRLDPLDPLMDELRAVNRRKEQGCLELASTLEGFSRRSEEIAREARTAAGILAGAESSLALRGLVEMVERMGARMEGWRADSARQLDVLEEILSLVGKVTGDLGLLRDVSRELNMLGIATRVQSSRLGRDEASFAVLADEIAHLSTVVGEQSGSLFARSRPLRKGIDAVLVRIHGGLDAHHMQSDSLLRTSRSVTASLEVLGASSVRGAQTVARHLAEIERSVSELVVSLQYEDITRQQVDDIILRIEAARAAGPGGAADLLAECADGLDRVRATIASQWGNLRAHFRALGEMIALLAQEIADAQEAGLTFLAELEKGIDGVTSYLSAAMATGRERADDLSRTAGDISSMSANLEAVEGLGEDIGLLALNARIKAAHLGAGGSGLRVVAESIQKVSLHANELAVRLARELAGIGASADGLGGEIRDRVQRDERELGAMIRELGALLGALRVLQGRVVRHLGLVREQGGALADEVRAGIARFTSAETSGEALGALAERMRRRAEESGAGPARARRVEQFAPAARGGSVVLFA